MICGITCGDINGIGPEIIVKYIDSAFADTGKSGRENEKYVIIIPHDVFEHYHKALKAEFSYEVINDSDVYIAGGHRSRVFVFALDNAGFRPGEPTTDSGSTAFNSILKSYELVDSGFIDFIVTAPISKYAFKLAGIDFPGHTELYAALDKSSDFMMCFLSENFNCGLATIHEPLLKVSSLITMNLLENKLEVIRKMLKYDLLRESPEIAVLGLNPHAGENGVLGTEEQIIINPFVQRHAAFLRGPFPPDAFFGRRMFKEYDFVFGMYHDQLLIPFKLLNQNSGVNYTAGLSFVRTSPDHGTGYNIAGKLTADCSSLSEAVKWGARIASNRRNSHATKD